MIEALKNKKVLHAPFEIAGNMAKLTKYLRKAGVHAKSVNYYNTWLKYQCDDNLGLEQLSGQDRVLAMNAFAEGAIREYDIFHFHFGMSLRAGFLDLYDLRKLKKKIIMSFWGSDVRAPEWILYHQAKYHGYDPPKPYFNTIDQYQMLSHVNRYTDVILAAACVPRGMRLCGQIDATQWTLEEKKKILAEKHLRKDPDKTYFVHAPSDNWKKGSKFIVSALEALKKKGRPIEIIYVHGVPLQEAKTMYAYADFAVDQVGVGAAGGFAMEMMAWEIPVLSYVIPLFQKIKKYPPIIQITKETFADKIEDCIQNKHKKKMIDGGAGRQWVLEHEHIANRFDEWLYMYETLARDEPVKQYFNKTWYEQEERILRKEKSDFYRYMKQSGALKEMETEVTGYDQRLYSD